MAYYVNDIIFQEDNMFNNEKSSLKSNDQTEHIVDESVASVEVAPIAEESVVEEAVVEQEVTKQPVVQEPVAPTVRDITPAVSNKYPGIAILTLGQQNDSVAKVQKELSSRGFSVIVNGSYDRATENAVASFCKSKGLYADGKSVGPRTWNHLFG
jgi:murein L,D-transpeptidase YcbB/YkuD